MRYFVNDKCIGCGLCAATCPAIFALRDDRAVAADVQTDDPDARDAMEACPVQAIEQK